MMKEIFDRIEIPSSKDIPDLAKMEELGETQWSIPDTRITLTQIAEGDAKGAFLFSKDTVGKVSNFYRELVSYPYKPSATTQGFYNFYITSPGGILPPKWAHFIPKWSDKVFFDQTIWQWFSSILIYGSTVIFLISVQKSLRSKSLNDNRLVSAWLALLLPSTILIFISLTDYIVDNIINLTGDVLQLIKWIDVVLNFLAGSWLAFVFVNAIGTTLAASKGFRDKPLTLIMLRNGFRLLGLVVGAIVLAIGCSTMGISLAPLLASLGAGSLALSFGLRPYIQDIIGGITLFANGAMKIGDYCEFNGVAGTVEDIGIRATLIRTTDRKLITVPNSGVSDTLVNYSRRDKYVFERILEISADTPRAQLPDLMDGLRQQLEDHPLVEDARVSLIGLNKAKIQIELFGYVLTTSSSDYMDIQSELLIFVADELAKQGIEGSLRV